MSESVKYVEEKNKILNDYKNDKITQYEAIISIDSLRIKNKHLNLTDVPVTESNIDTLANKPVKKKLVLEDDDEDFDDWQPDENEEVD